MQGRAAEWAPTPVPGFQVIKKFKEGMYNVLVATSIGEEGLDIGEVDMVICYDAQKTPIRMVITSTSNKRTLCDRLAAPKSGANRS